MLVGHNVLDFKIIQRDIKQMKRTLMPWDEWFRRMFRMYIWKQWKEPKTKVVNLRKLGIPADKTYQWGNSRLGFWRMAGSPVIQRSITNERLAATCCATSKTAIVILNVLVMSMTATKVLKTHLKKIQVSKLARLLWSIIS